MSDLIDELLLASKQSAILGDITFKGAYGFKKIELDVDKDLSEVLKKAPGHYVTLKFHKNYLWSSKIRCYITNRLCDSLKKFFNSFKPYSKILIVGLGNESMVCDSLGKQVTQNLIVLDKDFVSDFNIPQVCVLNPGVEGVTGIGSFELIEATISELKPDFVVAIDSLTANDVTRLGFTIQLSNAGINPGGGVNNCKNVLNKKTLGVNVLSLGVPLLIGIENLGVTKNDSVYHHFTPKEIDFVLKKCSSIIANALNKNIYSSKIVKLFL